MFRILSIIPLCLFFYSCGEVPDYRVLVSNPTELLREGDLAEFSVSELSILLPLDAEESYIVKDSVGNILTSQLTYDGKLLFPVTLGAHSSGVYLISKGSIQSYPSRVYGRYFEERYGDFAWENDKVGFRFYGSPLKSVQSPTNGLDLWYKRTDNMVLEKWYANELSKLASYHVDHGEGCDPYGVGPTLGGGAMAPYIDGAIVRNENFTKYEILDNGPLRLTAKLTYPHLTIGNESVKDIRTITLDAGSQYTRIEQDYGEAILPVVAGIVKRGSGDSLIVSEDKTNLIYIEPRTEEHGQIYLGLIFLPCFESTLLDSYTAGTNTFRHVLSLTSYLGRPLTYYTGFGWSKSHYPSSDSFERYTQDYVAGKVSPLQVRLAPAAR